MSLINNTDSTVANKIAAVQARIQRAALAGGRSAAEIALLAVSKTQPPDVVREAYAAGLRSFGENYVQEALAKISALSDLAICWHFIGAVQTNKTRVIAEHFNWVHSIDRISVAERLSRQRPAELPPLNVCIAVNLDDQPSKSGVSLAALPALARAVAALPHLTLRGLMAMPAPRSDNAAQVAVFEQLAAALAQLRLDGLQSPLDTLSMGMSTDLEVAITAGSTLVRVGTDIFGSRLSPNTQRTSL